MARRQTKNCSRKNAEAQDTTKGSKQGNGPSETSSKSASDKSAPNETPDVDQEDTKTTTDAAPTDQAHADRVAKTLANVERLLSQANDNSSADNPSWSQALEASFEKNQDRLSSQLDQFTKSFEKRFNELQQAMSKCLDSESMAKINAQTADQSSGDAKAEASDESESDWELRKRKIYADCGEDLPSTEDKSDKATSESTRNARTDKSSDDGDELASLQESLHSSIESLDDVPAEKIYELRAQLTAKLRDAEIEISINRAKLDQRKAELELRQTELDRREKSLNSKYANVDANGAPQQMGVLDRLTRHLGVRKKTDSL